MSKSTLSSVSPLLFVVVGVAGLVGCGASSTAPTPAVPVAPIAGYVEESEDFEVKDVVVTLYLPKDNPPREPYVEARKRREKTPDLATVRTEIEFQVEPKVKLKKFDFTITLNIAYGEHQVVAVSGAGTATRNEDGNYVTSIATHQPRPLELTDKLSIRVSFRGAATNNFERDDPAECKVTIKTEDSLQEPK